MKKVFYVLLTSILLSLLTISVTAENEYTYEVGDIIQIGSYPQSKVKDESLIAELNDLAPEWEKWTSYGYYSGTGHLETIIQGSWMRYVDITFKGEKYRGVKFTEYRPYYLCGSNYYWDGYQEDNGYNVNVVYWFKFEDLYWRVIDPNTGLVLCINIIDSQPYNNKFYKKMHGSSEVFYTDHFYTYYANNYKMSSIRQWLNNDFYNSAFNIIEKNEIKATVIDNLGYYTSLGEIHQEKYDCEETIDNVFLLSYNEARNSSLGFNPDGNNCDVVRRAKGSDYALCQGLYVFESKRNDTDEYNNNSRWLLRTSWGDASYDEGFYCRCVNYTGATESSVFTEATTTVYATDYGIRPAMYINNLLGIDKHEHIYQASIVKESNCWYEGTEKYTCSCGESYTKEIPVKHVYRKKYKRATMKSDGFCYYECKDCFSVDDYMSISKIDNVDLEVSEYLYNGKMTIPNVFVKDADGKTLVEGQDYDVIYPDGMKLPGKYEVKVLFKGNYLGEKHLSFTIKPKATTGLKAKTQDTKSITLSWSKTTGATGYRVYQYSSSKGEYVLKKSLTGTSYKVTGLKSGTTYKFKIRPYTKDNDGTVIWGADSKAFTTATKTATPTIKSVSNSSRKVTITWNNVSGESGYQIYYSTSKNGTYKKLASVGADKTKYTSDNLVAGKTYYFKVRAYKKVDDKTIYGDFCDVKSIKIPIVYYVTKSGKKYHIDGCRSLSKSKIQISYKDAVAKGYKPCSSCIK